MIIVREKQNNNEIYFENEIIQDKKTTCINEIYYRSFVKDKDDFTYLMLYDPNMNPISDVFEFLNYDKSAQSINSRIKSLQALKLLYCYQSIINKQLEDFTTTDINGLKYFLKGISPKGQSISFELISTRNNETVNGYLSVYRQFLTYLGKENKALNAKSSKTTLVSLPDSEVDYKVDRFKSNEKVPKKVIEVPRYISVDEFQKIINLVRNNYSVREEIIIRLMYQCGLRIGEVLGITADDLIMEELEGNYYPTLYIRNRISDKPFQQAKTCMKLLDKKQYKSKDYRTKGYGYQTVIIPEDLYNLINEYIEDAHITAREKKHNNYYSSTIADRVRKSEEYEDDNYYVFINSLGRPLSVISWNNIIREIFVSVGIPIDSETREHNLNHRFRHGFAMFNVQYLGCKELELKERMRHSNLQSVACYFRPTTSDAIKVKTEFTKSLYEVIPELNKGGEEQ